MFKILKSLFLLSLISFVLSSCATKHTNQAPQDDVVISANAPFTSAVTFTGSIPCETCERVDITLNILPDSMYQLRKTYRSSEGPAKIESQIGKWVYLDKDNLLILGKQKGLLKTYVVTSDNKLQFVEWEGTGNESQIQYELIQSPELDPFEDTVKITGKFSIKSGNGNIVECATEKNMTVRKEQEYATLQQNFLNTPHEPGRPLLVSVMGKIIVDEPDQTEFVVEEFRTIYSNRSCEGNKIKSSLTGTFWHLLEIDGIAVAKSANNTQPFLHLSANRSFEAYSGCNKITGGYLVKGDLFLINRNPDIRMACPKGLLLESTYIKALESSESYRVEGDLLELLDKNDQVRVKFQAGS
ncbi:MAG: META domain-containing protein [Desulfobulbaceae bacterium]|nr:META domain-containing protein [Desulfobulbaceae bacterium]